MAGIEIGIGTRMGLELDGDGDWDGSTIQEGGGIWRRGKQGKHHPSLALPGFT